MHSKHYESRKAKMTYILERREYSFRCQCVILSRVVLWLSICFLSAMFLLAKDVKCKINAKQMVGIQCIDS